MKKTRALFVCALLAGVAAVPAWADTYPSRAIKLIVAFPAGGSADIVARMVSQKVAELSGMNFVVENRTGAGGNIAFDATAAAQPDGYTLLFSTPGIAINPSLYRKVDYKLDQFTPITLVGEAPLLLMARPGLNIDSISALVAASKQAPDAIRFASSGNGSSSHLATEVLRSMSGLQYLHVPYKGGGAVMADLLGNRVDITMLPISESLPYVRDNRLRALGQTGATRAAIAPDIPTLAEEGVKGYAVSTWYMLLGPAKLPPPIVQTLHEKFSEALKAPDLQEKLRNAGLTILDQGPRQAKQFLDEQATSWAKAIAASGTKID